MRSYLVHRYRHYLKSVKRYIDGWVQDCSIPIAIAMEILQSYSKPSIYIEPHWNENPTTYESLDIFEAAGFIFVVDT